MKHKLISYVGWYGVAAILLAYIMVSFGLIDVKSYVYQLLNLTGSLGIIVEAASKKDSQPVVLNIIWSAVAVISLIKLSVV